MLIKKKINELSDDIEKLKPGEAFVMSFETDFVNKDISNTSILSRTPRLVNKKKIFMKTGKCYRDRYISKSCILSTKIVKILENIKKKRIELYGSQGYINTSVSSDMHNLKNLSSTHKKKFDIYNNSSSSEMITDTSLYDEEKKIINECRRTTLLNHKKTQKDGNSVSTTTDSFHTSNEKSLEIQDKATNGVPSKFSSTMIYENGVLKDIPTLSYTTKTSSSVANKFGIKPISPKLNRKIAKLIESEKKKHKNNEIVKIKEKKNINASKKPTPTNIQSEDIVSSLDSKYKVKVDSIYNGSQTSSANTALSVSKKNYS